ncbi:putative nicotinate-nucleotide adenylyltransferase [Hyphomicrobiales bacterium]|nr:putative nicotinate-nucleotide adenylyltransferase [Hyphomicrobiales bacterium]CAH1676054.1 putative nicotinate-nucleotide adenylyltransferase [Hyphomicrobiales bacterium]
MSEGQPRQRAPFPVLPPHGPGLAIGLFGGSFNPPHEGHRLASLVAMKRMGLDRVWWIVTPGNPLKDNACLPPLTERIAAAKAVADHPRIDVTGFEAAIGTRFTYDTLAYLRRRCPRTRFVWIMGADNLGTFHRWQNWRGIAALMPMAVVDRPGATIKAARAPAAVALQHVRMSERCARALPSAPPPTWVFLHGPRSAQSSTALRAQADPSPPTMD